MTKKYNQRFGFLATTRRYKLEQDQRESAKAFLPWRQYTLYKSEKVKYSYVIKRQQSLLKV